LSYVYNNFIAKCDEIDEAIFYHDRFSVKAYAEQLRPYLITQIDSMKQYEKLNDFFDF